MCTVLSLCTVTASFSVYYVIIQCVLLVHQSLCALSNHSSVCAGSLSVLFF